jgi:hypothetical protein
VTQLSILWTLWFFLSFWPPLHVFFLIALKKHYLWQSICLLPTLPPVYILLIEESDRTAHSAVSQARFCMWRTSMQDLSCITLLVVIMFYTNFLRCLKILMLLLVPFVWIIERLLFNSIWHHLTCICMIRGTSTHTDHCKHMQAHKVYTLFYICHRDM